MTQLPGLISYPCNECQAGMMTLNYITYFTWLDEELITVPNFPAWICDVCGKREYDERAVNWLTTLLSPSTGSGHTAVRRKPRRPAIRKRGSHRLPPVE